MDTKTANYNEDPFVYTEQLRECFDELKQKLQRTNSTFNNTVTAVSSQVLKQGCHDEISTKEQLQGSVTDNIANKSEITFPSHKPNEEKPILFQGHRSLPRIYNLTTDPSTDQDEKIWRRYNEYLYIATHMNINANYVAIYANIYMYSNLFAVNRLS